MAKFSDSLLNQLTEFLICEIGEKALSGITYALFIPDERSKKLVKKYMDIKTEAENCGYKHDEVFRVYKVSNGVIFDMDLQVAKRITEKLSESVSKANNGKTPTGDLIADSPEKRRINDINLLAALTKDKYDHGIMDFEVALFSRNSVSRIMVTGIGPKGEPLAIKYPAYAIRHWDIQTLNQEKLIPAGIRIASIEPGEILPSKTGVRFTIHVERIQL